MDAIAPELTDSHSRNREWSTPSGRPTLGAMNSSLHLSRDVGTAFLRRADEIQRAGLKSFGLFVADPTEPGYVYRPVAAVFLDPYRNRRNDPLHRAAFRAQGEYFRQYDDAGFVADPKDLLRAYREIDDAGLE